MQALNRLGEVSKTLIWIPSHQDILGNEIGLAKLGIPESHWRPFCSKKGSHQKLVKAGALELLREDQELLTVQTADELSLAKQS